MTLDDLITQLEEARENLGGDAEVRAVYQRSWPLRGTIANVCVPEDEDTEPHCGEHICYVGTCSECRLTRDEAEAEGYDPELGPGPDGGDPDRKMVWLAVGEAPYGENPYGPRWAWGE